MTVRDLRDIRDVVCCFRADQSVYTILIVVLGLHFPLMPLDPIHKCSPPDHWFSFTNPSNVFRAPYNRALDLCPVDRSVQLLIHKSTHNYVVASDHVHAVVLLFTGLFIVGRADNSLNGILEDEVRDLIAREEGAGQGSAVHCEDEDFFYVGEHK